MIKIIKMIINSYAIKHNLIHRIFTFFLILIDF